jgi:hypothetical protein
MLRRVSLFICLLTLAGAGACTPPPKPAAPNLIFSGGPQFVLPAEGKVEVVEQYQPPLEPPHVEHEFGLTPAQIARAWARDRIKVDPGDGTVRMTIVEASVVQNELKTDKGLAALFKNQPDRQLVAQLKVRLDYVGIAGSATATVDAMAERKISRNDTLLETEAAYYEMIESLAATFQRKMDESVRKHFARLFASPA